MKYHEIHNMFDFVTRKWAPQVLQQLKTGAAKINTQSFSFAFFQNKTKNRI